MKYILVLFILALLIACDCLCTDDKQYAHPLMKYVPAEAKFIKAYKDNYEDSLKNSHWIKYELDGECFIFSSQMSTNTKVECKAEDY